MSSAVRRRYQPAADADADHRGDYDPRFTIPEHLDPKKKKPSIKTVALAFALLISGTVLLFCYLLWYFGRLDLPDNETRGTSKAILILGCITFAPGALATMILVATYFRVDGFSYDMIPED